MLKTKLQMESNGYILFSDEETIDINKVYDESRNDLLNQKEIIELLSFKKTNTLNGFNYLKSEPAGAVIPVRDKNPL